MLIDNRVKKINGKKLAGITEFGVYKSLKDGKDVFIIVFNTVNKNNPSECVVTIDPCGVGRITNPYWWGFDNDWEFVGNNYNIVMQT